MVVDQCKEFNEGLTTARGLHVFFPEFFETALWGFAWSTPLNRSRGAYSNMLILQLIAGICVQRLQGMNLGSIRWIDRGLSSLG